MSGQYGRLSAARDKAHPITPATRVEVLATDLDAVLVHYATIVDELAVIKAARLAGAARRERVMSEVVKRLLAVGEDYAIIKRLRAYTAPAWGSALKDVHEAAAAIERLRIWRDTVDDMLITLHTTASDDPRESINRLINWHVATALDPAVSSDAAALVSAERERCAKILEANAARCKEGSLTRLVLETNAAAIRASGEQ